MTAHAMIIPSTSASGAERLVGGGGGGLLCCHECVGVSFVGVVTAVPATVHLLTIVAVEPNIKTAPRGETSTLWWWWYNVVQCGASLFTGAAASMSSLLLLLPLPCLTRYW